MQPAITLHIEANSRDDLLKRVSEALGVNLVTSNAVPPIPALAAPLAQPAPTTAPTPVELANPAPAAASASVELPQPGARRGRKSAAQKAAEAAAALTPPVSTPAPAVAQPPAVPASPSLTPTTPPATAASAASEQAAGAFSTAAPTIDDCRAALRDVNERHGLPAATALLAKYGAERISLLPEANRAAFIQACKEEVAKAPKS